MNNLDLAHIETSGLHLIEASAGTGKTWTIAARMSCSCWKAGCARRRSSW